MLASMYPPLSFSIVLCVKLSTKTFTSIHKKCLSLKNSHNRTGEIDYRRMKLCFTTCLKIYVFCLVMSCTRVHISESVNKQNMRYWSSQDAKLIYERLLHSDKVTWKVKWCVINSEGVIGPHFFEEFNHFVIINSGRYVNMIRHLFKPHLQQINLKLMWF